MAKPNDITDAEFELWSACHAIQTVHGDPIDKLDAERLFGALVAFVREEAAKAARKAEDEWRPGIERLGD